MAPVPRRMQSLPAEISSDLIEVTFLPYTALFSPVGPKPEQTPALPAVHHRKRANRITSSFDRTMHPHSPPESPVESCESRPHNRPLRILTSLASSILSRESVHISGSDNHTLRRPKSCSALRAHPSSTPSPVGQNVPIRAASAPASPTGFNATKRIPSGSVCTEYLPSPRESDIESCESSPRSPPVRSSTGSSEDNTLRGSKYNPAPAQTARAFSIPSPVGQKYPILTTSAPASPIRSKATKRIPTLPRIQQYTQAPRDEFFPSSPTDATFLPYAAPVAPFGPKPAKRRPALPGNRYLKQTNRGVSVMDGIVFPPSPSESDTESCTSFPWHRQVQSPTSPTSSIRSEYFSQSSDSENDMGPRRPFSHRSGSSHKRALKSYTPSISSSVDSQDFSPESSAAIDDILSELVVLVKNFKTPSELSFPAYAEHKLHLLDCEMNRPFMEQFRRLDALRLRLNEILIHSDEQKEKHRAVSIAIGRALQMMKVHQIELYEKHTKACRLGRLH